MESRPTDTLLYEQLETAFKDRNHDSFLEAMELLTGYKIDRDEILHEAPLKINAETEKKTKQLKKIVSDILKDDDITLSIEKDALFIHYPKKLGVAARESINLSSLLKQVDLRTIKFKKEHFALKKTKAQRYEKSFEKKRIPLLQKMITQDIASVPQSKGERIALALYTHNVAYKGYNALFRDLIPELNKLVIEQEQIGVGDKSALLKEFFLGGIFAMSGLNKNNDLNLKEPLFSFRGENNISDAVMKERIKVSKSNGVTHPNNQCFFSTEVTTEANKKSPPCEGFYNGHSCSAATLVVISKGGSAMESITEEQGESELLIGPFNIAWIVVAAPADIPCYVIADEDDPLWQDVLKNPDRYKNNLFFLENQSRFCHLDCDKKINQYDFPRESIVPFKKAVKTFLEENKNKNWKEDFFYLKSNDQPMLMINQRTGFNIPPKYFQIAMPINADKGYRKEIELHHPFEPIVEKHPSQNIPHLSTTKIFDQFQVNSHLPQKKIEANLTPSTNTTVDAVDDSLEKQLAELLKTLIELNNKLDKIIKVLSQIEKKLQPEEIDNIPSSITYLHT